MKKNKALAMIMVLTMATQTVAFAVIACWGGLKDEPVTTATFLIPCSQVAVGPGKGSPGQPENGCVAFEIEPCRGKVCDDDGNQQNWVCSGAPDLVDRIKTTKRYSYNPAAVMQDCGALVSTTTSTDGTASFEKLVSCLPGS